MRRLLAIGDIHGCYDSFKKLVEENINLQKREKLILLGDYIDRGPQSKDVVDYILKLQEDGFDVIPIKGNHEAMLLEAYSNKDHVSRWIQNGGGKTLSSFGIDSIGDLDPRYLEFFSNLCMYYEFDNYIFVHAGFNNDIDNPFEDSYHMLWKCRNEYSNPTLKDKVIIHGHCTVSVNTCDERIRNNHDVLNLDTGRVYSGYSKYGRLTALELYTRTIYFD